MSRFEIVSIALFAMMLASLPVLAWSFMMYQALGVTGSVLAAI